MLKWLGREMKAGVALAWRTMPLVLSLGFLAVAVRAAFTDQWMAALLLLQISAVLIMQGRLETFGRRMSQLVQRVEALEARPYLADITIRNVSAADSPFMATVVGKEDQH